MRVLVLLLTFCLIPLAAQTSAPAKQKAAEDKSSVRAAPPGGTVSGTISCADTHRPARGATVLLSPLPVAGHESDGGINGTTHTAMDGSYAVHGVRPGDYIIVVIFAGYMSPVNEFYESASMQNEPNQTAEQIRKRLASFQHVKVEPAQTTRVDVELDRGSAVSGRVMYSDGSPAAGITITAEAVPPPGAKAGPDTKNILRANLYSSFVRQSLNTDDQGRYRIAGLAPREYRIFATQESEAPTDYSDTSWMAAAWNLSRSVRIYSGNTLLTDTAKTYKLAAGDELRGVDIEIALDAFHRVHGTVSAKDGRVINSGAVTLKDLAHDDLEFSTNILEDGSFTVAVVPSGTYRLTVHEARIRVHASNPEDRFQRLLDKAYFADASRDFIVKDSDLLDATMTVIETEKPPEKKEDSDD